MAVVVAREHQQSRSASAIVGLGWPAIAASASLGAGAIHAAVIGTHSEHRQAMVVFTVVAAAQLGWGALALARPARRLLALGAVLHVAILGGWMLAKVDGIAFVDGLEARESVQTADGVAASLALVAAVAAIAGVIGVGQRALKGAPGLTGGMAVLLAASALPGMLAVGTHVHAHGVTAEEEPTSAVPPKPYDPALPIDLGGVPGVTPQQQARAENLIAVTLLRLPQFADAATAEAMGFVSIGDGALGHEHYLSAANMADDRILDPDYPESLVYDTSVTPKRLAAAMFMMNPGDTLADVPDIGGPLTQWHVHDNLCFAGPRVAGLTDAAGNCAPGLTKGVETPMIHVWIESHPCGPFAALEGVAGGTVPEGEERLCDHAHGA